MSKRFHGGLAASLLILSAAYAQDSGTSPETSPSETLSGIPSLAPDAQSSAIESATLGDDAVVAAEGQSDLASRVEMRIQSADLPERVKDFYQNRDFEPVFIADRAVFDALVKAVATSDEQGLVRARYSLADDAALGADDDINADLEIRAVQSFLQYAEDLKTGMTSPEGLSGDIKLKKRGFNAERMLADAVEAEGFAAFLRALEPQDRAYAALKAELGALRAAMESDDDAPAFSNGATLRLGDSGARVAELRSLLAYLGYETTALDRGDFDQDLSTAVKTYQSDQGLTSDGIVGPSTYAALTGAPGEKMQKVLVGLERHRWNNHPVSGRRIHVNIPAYQAQVRDNNQVSFETDVVVGKAESRYRTPEFNDTMTYMVVNPIWNVPGSIAIGEYLPKIKRDPDVLARANIDMIVPGSGQVIDPRRIDMSQFTVNDFPFVLKQRPGIDNALGDVKFMFPNPYAIYLHDTPAKSLFNRSSRAFSHGCIRVAKPRALAEFLLAPQSSSPSATYSNYTARKGEVTVNLQQPVPIYLEYLTAWLNNSDQISYSADIYGRDRLVASRLRDVGLEI